MDEEQLQLLYNSYASKKGFSDYNEFKSLINNEGSRKVFFESSNKELGFKSYDEFNNLVGLKKKEESKPTSQEKLWGSGSKPKDLYTSLVTDAPKKTTASVSLDGKPKKVFKEAPKEVVEEEEDGLGDYLLNTIDFGIAQASKSVYDTPGFIYDQISGLITTPLINLGADILGVERPKEATSKSLAKSLGFENVPSNILKAKLAKINKKITEEEASYGGTVLDAMENKNYGGALAITVGSALKSAPAMVLSWLSGGGTAGAVVLGYTSAATKSAQLEEEQPNLSVTDRSLNATTSGAIEATLGQVFTGASGAVTKKILQTNGKAGAKVISNAFVRIASKYVEKNPMVNVVGGIAEETGVSLLNQYNDMATGIRSEINFKEAFNEGVSSLGMNASSTLLVYGAKGYVSNKKYRQVKSLNKNIDKFRRELDKEDISPESREFFKIKSDELEAKNKELLGSEIEKLKMLSNEDKALLNGSNKKIEAFSNSIDKIKNDKALSVEAKKIAIKEIIKDLSAAKKAKNDIISKAEAFEVTGDFSDFNGVPIDFDIETSGISSLPIDKQNSLNKEAFDALNKELNPTGKEQVDVTKEMVSKRASEMYDLEVSANKEVEVTKTEVEKVAEPVSEEITQNQEVSPEVDVVVPSVEKKKIFKGKETFAHAPNGDKFDADSNIEVSDRVFKITEDENNPNIASYDLMPGKLNLILNYPSKYIKPVANELNAIDQKAKEVIFEPGLLVKKGNEWIITKKASINYGAKKIELKDSKSTLTDKSLDVEDAKQVVKKDEDTEEESRIKDSQIPLKRETFQSETDSGNPFTIEVTTNKDGSRKIVTKVDGTVSGGELLSKNNTLSTIEYLNAAHGEIQGDPKVEQGNDIMSTGMKDKLTPKQKEELGITDNKEGEEAKPVEKKETPLQEIKGNALDIFKAGLQAISITKATAKAKLKNLTDTINSLSQDENGKPKKGGLSIKQANSLIKRIGMLNLDNPKTTQKIIDYATKIIADSEYKDKLDGLDGIVSSIKKKVKGKDVDPDLADMVKKFVSLNPKDVEDVDAYLDIANNINRNIKGSTARGGNLNISEGIDKSALNEYVNKEVERADTKRSRDVEESFFEKTGLDPKDFSYEEVQEMIYSPTEDTDKFSKYDELNLRSKIKKASGTMKAIVKDMVQNGINSFSLEKINISDEKKAQFKALLNINVDNLTKQESLMYIDILNDIVVNGYSNKMELFSIKVNGKEAAVKASKSFLAKKVKLFGSGMLARGWNEQIASIPAVTEAMMRSIKKGEDFLDTIGFERVRKGTNKATREVNSFLKTISDAYVKTKPNGEDFTSKFNDHERGMSAFMMMSTDKDDFERNKLLIEKSIDNLTKNGDSQQKEIAKSHKKVYDKILKDSKSVDEVISKSDKINIDAVNKFIEFNDSKFKEKENVSKYIYNSSLLNKKNYTPISYKLISKKEKPSLSDDAFESSIISPKEKIYDKKSGTFIESKKPSTVNENSYISLDFLSDNERKAKESLVDTYTAKDIQFMKAFVESPSMKDIVPDSDDRKLFVERLKHYVKIKRNRLIDDSPEIVKATSKVIEKASRLAVSRSLGGVGQALNQTVPVATSTLINSQRLDIIAATNSDWNNLIDNSGYDIANRGLESSSDFAAFSKLLEQANENKVDRAIDLLSKGQEFWLKTFLGKPDVFIARASWISFYKKGLESQGKSSDINPNLHEINDEAARYAQAQVDRQQNVSDPSLEGKWLSSKNSGSKITRSMVLPFAKFALNQKTRMYNDSRTLFSLTSSKEDKKTASLSLIGLAAEMLVFSYVSNGIKELINKGVDSLMDYEEEEEEEKERVKKSKENLILSVTSNVLSPITFVDFAFQGAVGLALDKSQDALDVPKEEKLNVQAYRTGDLDKFGLSGISLRGYQEIGDYESLLSEGKFKVGGGEKSISEKDLGTLKKLRPLFYLNQMGLLPRDVSYGINRAVKVSKKRAESKQYKKKTSTF